jgi:hypothetical protein
MNEKEDVPVREGPEKNLGNELERLRAALRFYETVIARYSEFVNASEQKTIPELKALVKPKDESIVETKDKLLSELGISGGEYRLEHDFLPACEKAFALTQSFEKVHHLGISFWLSPKEMLELKAADSFDKSMFLCSLLQALGCESAKVRVLELEEGINHPVVTAFYAGRQFLLDPSQEASAFTFEGQLSEVLEKFSYDGKRVVRSLYEFNNSEYTELS